MCPSCPSFEKTLHYVSPAHGGWGVIRIAATMPESYMLFVAPFACGRHGALGAVLHHIKNQVSYLFIDESDIVSGNYEHLVPDAVEELLAALEKRPKVLMIFVSCLDDLLGTDHEALNARLSEKFTDIRFVTCHMNPFKMDTKVPPQVGLQRSLFSILEKSDVKKNQINMVGNNASVSEDCELFTLMNQAGWKINHIGTAKTLEEFLDFSSSKLNLVLSPSAGLSSKIMEKNLGIPYLPAIPNYDVAAIEKLYHEIENRLGISLGDLSSYKERAVKAIQNAQSIIGDYPVMIDYQAVRRPFTLANVLHDAGFNVKLIAVDAVPGFEKAACEKIMEKIPDLKIIDALHHDSAKFEFVNEECLCIGFNAGYLTKSRHVVDLMEDETLYGFYGVEKLMDMLVTAYQGEHSADELIIKAGIVV
ncbi:nitrogenase component 1 [Treponema sp.]|uniref:nitrogenase component 1 n=1 Tax=Treponema sp. TaxID=166 RepID=UPI00388F0387